MKTALTVLIILSLLTILLTGCGQAGGPTPKIVRWEMTPAGVYAPRYQFSE
jgi:hypothetical protein